MLSIMVEKDDTGAPLGEQKPKTFGVSLQDTHDDSLYGDHTRQRSSGGLADQMSNIYIGNDAFFNGLQSVLAADAGGEGVQQVDTAYLSSMWEAGDMFTGASDGISHARQKSTDLSGSFGNVATMFSDSKAVTGTGGGSSGKPQRQKKGHYEKKGKSGVAGKVHVDASLLTQDQDGAAWAEAHGVSDKSLSDKVKRTVYVADVHHQVSEQELARFFSTCGPIVDYRICGDTNTVLRFAFIEFHSVVAAREALKLTGSLLGECVIRVSPSKTAIIPVKDQFLPRSEREREAVARTVYVANIHQTVERDVLRQFFQMVCGPVSKIRLLGDAQHDTKIAFVEFASKDSTSAALRCTGAMLGPLAIRVSPSKTPVRTDARRRAATDQTHLPTDAATVAAKITNQLRQNLRHGGGRQKKTNGSHGGKNGGQKMGQSPAIQAIQKGDGDAPASPTIMSLLEGILSD